MQQILEDFFPAPSLSTTSSLQTTRGRLRGAPRRRNVPEMSASLPEPESGAEPSSSRGWLSRSVMVREPSEGAEVIGRCRVATNAMVE